MTLTQEEQQKLKKLFKVKKQFICPLSNKLIRDPVFVEEDPLTMYDRAAIEKWFTTNNTLPSTRKMTEGVISVNYLFAKQLEDYKHKVAGKCLDFAMRLIGENREIESAAKLLSFAAELIASENTENIQYDSLIDIYENMIKCFVSLKQKNEEANKRVELIGLLQNQKYVSPSLLVHLKAVLLTDLKDCLDKDQRLFLFQTIVNFKLDVITGFKPKELNRVLLDFANLSPLYSLTIEQDLFQLLPDIKSSLDHILLLAIVERLNYPWPQFRVLLKLLFDMGDIEEWSTRLDQIVILKMREVNAEDALLVAEIGIEYYEWRYNSTSMTPEFFEYGKKLLAILADLDPENTKLRELQIDHCDSDTKEMLKVLTVQMMKLMTASNEMKKEINELRVAKEQYELDKKQYCQDINQLHDKCDKLTTENTKLSNELTELQDEFHTSAIKKYKAKIKRIIKREEEE